tara:strand:+ start:7718 stop:8125 length:408 start_codon:yes stop_codon:yes gene_type:complete
LENIENISINGDHCALILRSNYSDNGIKFFTDNESPLQLGYMNRPKNYKIKPHIHIEAERKIKMTHEVLFIKSGKVKITFYDKKKIPKKETILEKGDVILLTNNAHGFEMLEDCEIIEVKQGPYMGDLDKERFDF